MQSRATSMAPGICFLTASMAKQKVSSVSTGLVLDFGSGGMVLFWPNETMGQTTIKKKVKIQRMRGTPVGTQLGYQYLQGVQSEGEIKNPRWMTGGIRKHVASVNFITVDHLTVLNSTKIVPSVRIDRIKRTISKP